MMLLLYRSLNQAAQPWGKGPSLAPCPRAKYQEAFAMDGGSRQIVVRLKRIHFKLKVKK